MWHAIGLISGTAVGAGMLALPLVTAPAGFLPAVMVTVLTGLIMLLTGLALLEVCLWMPAGSNMASMSRRFLGFSGELALVILYLFLYYSLLVAYSSAGESILRETLGSAFGLSISQASSLGLFMGALGLIIWAGTRVTSRLNFILSVGILLTFIAMFSMSLGYVHLDNLGTPSWHLALGAAPVFFGAFGFHNIIPTVVSYLKNDGPKLRRSLVVGLMLPICLYVFWQFVVMGIVPNSILVSAQQKGSSSGDVFLLTDVPASVGYVTAMFSFFALVTSLLGVCLSMVDFLADGLKVSREGFSRAKLCMLVCVPPALVALYYPGLFLTALGIAGGFGEATLNGLFPLAMLWIGRYQMKLEGEHCLPGGRPMIFGLVLCIFVVIGVEAMDLWF